MPQTNPYAAPAANVAEPSPVRPRAPKVLLTLLLIYFALEVFGAFASGQVFTLAKTAIVAIAAWKTIQGSQAASRILGALFVLGTVIYAFQTVSLVRTSAQMADVMATAIVAILTGTIAVYVFFSPSMKALYKERERKQWRM